MVAANISDYVVQKPLELICRRVLEIFGDVDYRSLDVCKPCSVGDSDHRSKAGMLIEMQNKGLGDFR